MGQDSKRKRFLRRVKRERTQLRQAVGVQQQQLQTVVKMLMEAQAEVRELKAPPSFTIETKPDAPPEDPAALEAAFKYAFDHCEKGGAVTDFADSSNTPQKGTHDTDANDSNAS